MPKIPRIKEKRNLIDKHMAFLLSEIDSKHLYPLFYERGKINEEEMEKLAIIQTTKKRNYEFLKYVKERDPNLHTFFEALRKNKSEHVIDTLMSPGNGDEKTGNLENESCNVTSTGPGDFPTTYRGKLVFQSKEYCSDNNYRYCWMYFYLENINKTMKVVLFDTDVDRYNDLEENGMYELKNINLERHSQRAVYKDIRETFPFTAKLGPNSSICMLNVPKEEDVPIPDLQFMDIKGTKKLQENKPVHVKGFVFEVMEAEKQGEGSIPTLSVSITDDTGRMTVRIFDMNEGDDYTRKFLNKQIVIDHGITKLNLQNGTKEIHVTRYTRVLLEDPVGGIPDFDSTEEEAESPFFHIEDLIKQSTAGSSIVVRTKAYVLAIRRKNSKLVVPEHKECGGKIETLRNRRDNCRRCKRLVRQKNRSLAYDMRAKIWKRKPCVVERWMNVNKNSAEVIMGISAEEFSLCNDEDKEKMIRNSKSILFELKIMKKPNLKKPHEYIYNVIGASNKSEESSDDSDW